jgi:hypothetical protein
VSRPPSARNVAAALRLVGETLHAAALAWPDVSVRASRMSEREEAVGNGGSGEPEREEAGGNGGSGETESAEDHRRARSTPVRRALPSRERELSGLDERVNPPNWGVLVDRETASVENASSGPNREPRSQIVKRMVSERWLSGLGLRTVVRG